MKNLVADPVEHSAIRKIAIRLVPFIALMFFINYLDRTAISFAGPNGMDHALGLTAAQFGFASGAALPSFWTIPSQFLTGAAAAAGIALINTAGNFAGFAAGYITGALKDWTGSYIVPMFLVGGFMLLSAICMVAISAGAPASPRR
jgi:nitrate/nitrite transporter NarK